MNAEIIAKYLTKLKNKTDLEQASNIRGHYEQHHHDLVENEVIICL